MKYQQTLLSDLFDIGSSKRVLKSQWRASGIPFYRGREVTKLSEDGYVENELFIDPEHFEQLASKSGVPSQGDIIITAIGTIGNTYIVKENDKFYFKDASVLWLKKKSQIVTEYINWWFKSSSMKSQLDEGNGATVDTLTIKKLQSLIVPVPPIDEQKRIVAMLDEAFADIDKARELTEQNLKNAHELFESYLQKIFKGVTSSDSLMRLEDLVTSDCSLSYGIVQPGDNIHGGVPVVRPVDLTSEILYRDGLKRVLPKVSDGYKRTILTGDELLLCVRGSTGKFSMAHPELAGANVTRGIVPIRFDDNRIEKRFAFYQFLSPIIQKQIKAATYGAALMQINIRDLKKIKMVVPTLENQRKTIGKLEAVYPELLRTAEIYENKLRKLDELKSAVLQRSFQYHCQ